jgi:hypothetical protein
MTTILVAEDGQALTFRGSVPGKPFASGNMLDGIEEFPSSV